MEFQYNITEDGKEKLVIDLIGDLDVYTSGEIKDDLLARLERDPKDIYLNCEKLEYMDSTGLGVLIAMYNSVKNKEAKIYIRDLKPNVKKIFEITQMDKVFHIKD